MKFFSDLHKYLIWDYSKNWVKWADLGLFCYFCWEVWKNVNLPPIMWCDNGFKNYENKCKFIQSETLISHFILFLEQVEIMATANTSYPCLQALKHPFLIAHFVQLMIWWWCWHADEAFTAIIKIVGSHLQVGIVQTVQQVTQCLWANYGEKPVNSIASWRNVTSYTEFPL